MALPDPPLLERALFEAPWAYAAALVVVGFVARAILLRQEKERASLLCAIGGVVLGAGLIALASAVTTQRERLVERTRELVRLVASGDGPSVERMLAGEVGLRVLGSEGVFTREQMGGQVGSLSSVVKIKGAKASQVRAALDSDEVARTSTRVWADLEGELYSARQGSDWILSWRRLDGEAWQVMRIECVKIDGLPQSASVPLPR